MIILILILGGICALISAVGYYAIRHQDLKEYRDAITIVCALLAGTVVIFGIFAFDMGDKTEVVSTDDPASAQTTPASTAVATVLVPSSETSTTEIKSQAVVEPTVAILHKPGDILKDCDVCPEMVVVPAGENNVGEKKDTPGTKSNEYPHAWISLAEHFAVGRYEVKVSEFKHFVAKTNFQQSTPCNTDGVGGKNANYAKPGLSQGPEHPVVCVSLHDARQFTKWLSNETGHTYSLLSEARWEYARRSATLSQKNPEIRDTEELHNFGNIRGENWTGSTMEVGRYDANQFLLFDMIGNAAEWTADCWLDDNLLRPKDGRAVLDNGDCTSGAVRGGSWDERHHAARPASRRKVPTGLRDWRIGFRVMRLIKSNTQTSSLSE